MNWEKHRYTKSQVHLSVYTHRWRLSEYGGWAMEGQEFLKRHPRPEQMHPAYRRRRRKHPAFYSIRYISEWKISKQAWLRYHKTVEEQKRSMTSRRRRHPLLQQETSPQPSP